MNCAENQVPPDTLEMAFVRDKKPNADSARSCPIDAVADRDPPPESAMPTFPGVSAAGRWVSVSILIGVFAG